MPSTKLTSDIRALLRELRQFKDPTAREDLARCALGTAHPVISATDVP